MPSGRHRQEPRLRKQHAENHALAGPNADEFLSGLVASGKPISCARDEMLSYPDLILVTCDPASMAICGRAASCHSSSSSRRAWPAVSFAGARRRTRRSAGL